jgi:hypothetical protein
MAHSLIATVYFDITAHSSKNNKINSKKSELVTQHLPKKDRISIYKLILFS